MVVADVTTEAQLYEEPPTEAYESVHALRELVQRGQRRARVQVGIGSARDEQCAFSEAQVGLSALDVLGKPLDGFHFT
jgi:hypothetical protein